MHSVKSALQNSASEIDTLFVQRGRRDRRLRDLQTLARRHTIAVVELGREQMNELLPGVQHQGVILRLLRHSSGLRSDLPAFIQQRLANSAHQKALLLLVLDEVQDPHNLGACLRSADATGVDAVIIPADNSAGLTAIARKVASGAAEQLPLFQVSNLQRALKALQEQGVWIYGAAGDAEHCLYDLALTDHIALVLGAEGRGMRRLTRERCDRLFHLPMLGSVSSLNVSVAAGVSLFEVVRQRRLLL